MFEKMSLARLLLRSLFAVAIGFAVAASQTAPLSAQDVGRQSRAQIVVQLGHSAAVRSLAFSPDRRTALSGGEDATLKLWDLASGREIRTFAGHSERVYSVAFSPDGRTALSGSHDKTFKLWDVASGREMRTFRGHSEGVTSVAFSPDGRTVLSGSWDGTIKFWDVANGREIRTLKRSGRPSNVGKIAFSPDGRTALSGYRDGSVRLFDVASGRELRTFSGHSDDTIDSVEFSPNGRTFLSLSHDRTAKLWDVASGRTLSTIGNVLSVAFLPDGRTVLSGSMDDKLSLWDVASGRMLRTFADYSLSAWSLAVSPGGHTALLGGGDGTVRLFDLAGGRELRNFSGRSDVVSSVAFSPDGRTVLSGVRDGTLKLWDVASGREVRTFRGDFGSDYSPSVAFSTDGRTALSGGWPGMKIRLWDLTSGRELKTFIGDTNEVTSVAFSPDGRTALSGSRYDTFRLWDVASGREIRAFNGHESYVWSAAFSPDGRTALSGSGDNTLKLWDVTSGREIRTLTGHTSSVFSVSFSRDGRTALSGSLDRTARLWDVASGQVIRVFMEHSDAVFSVALSHDGRTALSGSGDGTVRLWDVASGRELRNLTGHSGGVSSVAFSPDGRTSVSGSSDRSMRLWDNATGAERARMLSFNDGSWLTITPEGFFDASSPQAAQNLNIVRELEIYSIDQVYQVLYRPDLVREKLAGDPKGLVREAAAKLDLNKVMASGAAPRVSIVTPEGNVANDESTIEAEIAEQSGGGIGKIEWRINGVTLGVESRGIKRLTDDAAAPSAASRSIVVKRTLSLEPGENRIEIVAYNGRDLIASDPAQVVLKWDGEKSATPPKLHVLAVGVNDYYDSRLKLSYAVPDARALGDALKQGGSSLYQSVEVTSVLDDKVTVDNLDQVFADLGKKVHARDVFVFFLAGHGKTVDGRYHFLPQDFRYEDESSIVKRGIDQERFQAWFARIPARKSILLYDTCESGSLTGDRVQQRGIERVAALEKMTRAMGRTVLSASSDDAPALEGYRGHGVFTYALLVGLQAADTNGNGLIEVTELAAFIDQKVPDLSYQAFKLRQIPQMKIVGSSFPVVSKAAVLQTSDATPSSEPVSTKPTHVVVSPSAVEVFPEAAPGGTVVQRLPPGTLVTLMATANGWQLVAKDGRKLGYVEQKALLKLQ